jgi:hypothetical protein
MKIFKFKITWTNLVGAVALFWSIKLGYDQGLWAGSILVLGRAAIPEITKMIEVFKGVKKDS